MNLTFQTSDSQWRNQVWLSNSTSNNWDLVYEYNYSAARDDQRDAWAGSWGPIVETFQNFYENTSPMGALNTQLMSEDASGNWGAWHQLGTADTEPDPRTDNVGFKLAFLDPNYSWVVTS